MPFEWRVRAPLFRNFGHDVDQGLFDTCQVKQSEASHVASNCHGVGDSLKVSGTFALQTFHKKADDVDDVAACKGTILKNGKENGSSPVRQSQFECLSNFDPVTNNIYITQLGQTSIGTTLQDLRHCSHSSMISSIFK